MNIKPGKKFTNKHLDEFIDGIYRNLITNPSDNYVFDLTDVEYIENQELLVLSGLFKTFVKSKIKFKVLFFQQGTPSWEINDRVKRQIIQFWDVWEIWRIVPPDECRDYFGIDDKYVNALKKELTYYPEKSEIYRRHGVTPFVTLNYINNYDETEIQKLINPIYQLNSVIEELLEKNRCHHPFTSYSLSTIITEELYLNFLDHSLESPFPTSSKMAFMSISFHPKLEGKDFEKIQRLKAYNFESECLLETKNFFVDPKTKRYKNQPYIEFSFLDFGEGISETLKDEYLKENKSSRTETLDSDILEYSFNHHSSRHPIYDEKNKVEKLIPRGLFDALTIVRRYRGLLIARSNFGKILFDFSDDRDLDKAFSYFGDNKLFFPGTIISLYIPAIEDDSKLDTSAIKPETVFAKVKPENKKYVSINTIAERLDVPKKELYPKLLHELKREIYTSEEPSLVFISFKGCDIDKRIIKKTIYLLLTDYQINHHNNIVILNSPPENIINDIASEILSLNTALRNYKLHPLPIIDFDKNNEDLNVKWLGIYDDTDKEKLNDLLYEEYSIARSDFNDPANVTGHLNAFDSYGNLISNFPNRANIVKFYRDEDETITSKQVEDLLTKHECIKEDNKTSLYLGSGNSYQKEFVEMDDLVNDQDDCNTIANLLYLKLKFEIESLEDFKFIGITNTSHKILNSLERQNLISPTDYISLDNYHTLEIDLDEGKVDPTKRYILVCHVVSSGSLIRRLNARLIDLGTSIEYIAVVTSVVDPHFKPAEEYLADYEGKIFSLHQYPIAKFKRSQLGDEIFSKEIIRINPYTNIPIRLSIDETNFNESVIFHTQIGYSKEPNEITFRNKFLDNISEDAIHIGFLKFNNVIHPYFFNTEIIFHELQDDLLEDIFGAIDERDLDIERIKVFYPRKSGVDFFNFGQLKSVLKNHHIEAIEIERFGTPEGWKFPHNSDYLGTKIENSFCFILDDGSCSGDSLIQMIDEISFYDVQQIVLLCFIGRVKNHKREFFSRLSHIKVKNKKTIPISIYFVSHWHIPTYNLDENPNTQEATWLNFIVDLQNTPQSIKDIAKIVLTEITPKTHTNADHKYLPKTKDAGKIPKKELLMVRDELGKAIGYRLYKESFIFFDSFIKKYEKKAITENRYREIELLCATFIYEPYLYDKIVSVLPDVVEQIEEFVRVLIFSNEKIYEMLSYKWRKKDIIHLFFIVFKEKKLIRELTIERFKQLLEFTQQVNSTTNYILYKLLNYFPLTPNQFMEKKFDGEIKDLIVKVKDDASISTKEVKKYYNFITSLPSREDFNSQLAILVDNYRKQETQEYHLEKKSFDSNISNIISSVRDCIFRIENNKSLDQNRIYSITDKWFKVLGFVLPILRFSSSFPDYLVPYPYFDLIASIETGEGSVREIVGYSEKVIFSLDEQYSDKDKLFQLEKDLAKMQLAVKTDSTFYQLIKDRTSSLNDLMSHIFRKLNDLSISYTVTGQELLELEHTINIPKLYADELLKRELVTNIENHGLTVPSSQVSLELFKDGATLNLKITNEKARREQNKSNLEGIKCLNLMAGSELFGFSYTSYDKGAHFGQHLKFQTG